MEITLPNSQGSQDFRSVAGKRSNGRAVYLGDPRLALLGRSPVGVEKSTLTTPCPVAAGSVFSGKVQSGWKARGNGPVAGGRHRAFAEVCESVIVGLEEHNPEFLPPMAGVDTEGDGVPQEEVS